MRCFVCVYDFLLFSENLCGFLDFNKVLFFGIYLYMYFDSVLLKEGVRICFLVFLWGDFGVELWGFGVGL